MEVVEVEVGLMVVLVGEVKEGEEVVELDKSEKVPLKVQPQAQDDQGGVACVVTRDIQKKHARIGTASVVELTYKDGV